jgi:hypothetical protein
MSLVTNWLDHEKAALKAFIISVLEDLGLYNAPPAPPTAAPPPPEPPPSEKPPLPPAA